MPRRPSALGPSALVGTWLDLEGERFRIVAPTPSLGRQAMAEWTAGARSRLVDWSWAKLLDEYPEALALVDASGCPRALFCSRRRRLLSLPAGPTYELGYLEVHPRDRGGVLAFYVFATAAARALEVGASGLVLGAIPEPGLLRFYTVLGGTQGHVKGWKAPHGLVPYFFRRETLVELQLDHHAASSKKA